MLLFVQEECRGRMMHPERFRLAPADRRPLIHLDDDVLILLDRRTGD